jgi:hypothetical protein
MVILVVIAISIIDGTNIARKQLKKEFWAFVAFAAITIIYGYFYFSPLFNASIADVLNQVILHK